MTDEGRSEALVLVKIEGLVRVSVEFDTADNPSDRDLLALSESEAQREFGDFFMLDPRNMPYVEADRVEDRYPLDESDATERTGT